MNYTARFAIVALSCISATGLSQDNLSASPGRLLFAKGIELIEHKNYAAAREVFSDYLKNTSKSDPLYSEAAFNHAFASVSMGHSDGEKLIDDFILGNPNDPRAATAYFELANFFYEDNNYSKAAAYFKRADLSLLEIQKQVEARFRWGYSQFSLRRFDEALEQFNYIKTQSNQYTPAANYYAGFIYYSDAQYDEALIDLKRAELNQSYANVVPNLIVLCYYKQHLHRELLDYVAGLSGKEDDVVNYPEILAVAGDAAYFIEDYKIAAAYYNDHLDGEVKGEGGLLFRAGFANYAIGNDEAAVQLLKAASGDDAVIHESSYYLGLIYLKHDNKPYALNAFELASKCSSCEGIAEESSFQLGKLNYDLGHPDKAIEVLERFRSSHPGSRHTSEVNELLAQAYVNGNNYNKAIAYIEAMPRRTPAVDRAYQKATYLKGAELFNMGDYAAAVTSFEHSLKYPIDNKYVALASLWCGEAYSIGSKYSEGSQHYLTVIGLGADVDKDVLLRTRYGLGYSFFNLEQYDRALVSFREFVGGSEQNNNNFVDALIRLADCYYIAKRYDEALRSYSRARQFNTADNDYIFLQMGMIYGITARYGEARSNFGILINSYSKSPYRDEAIFQNAQFEIEQGNYSAAVEGLSRLISEMKNSKFLPYAFMRRAASNFNLKEYGRTANDYIFVLQNFPHHATAQQALLPLQEALNISGRSGEFEGYLNAYKQSNPDRQDLEVVEFETAKNFYFNQQYDRAIARLNSYLEQYTSSANAPEARYYLAESHYRQNALDRALPLYQSLAEDSHFTLANRVVGRVAEINFRLGDLENSVRSFHRLESIADSKKELYNAWSGLMESFFLLGRYDSTDFYARLIIEKGNVNASAVNKATLYLGKSAMAKGDYEAAKDEFVSTINAARDEYGAEAKYRLGEIFYFTKQHMQCYETLVALNSEFSAYDEWVGRSFLLLADNFLSMGDEYQAKATLQSLVDNFPLEPIKSLARDRLAEIERGKVRNDQDSTSER